MKYIIPTLGRIDNQITYDNLPKHVLKDTYLVVQQHEGDLMKDKYPNANVLVLPEHINRFPPTREWCHNYFKEHRYFLFDDDLKVKTYSLSDDGKWTAKYSTDDEFDTMIAKVEQFMDDGYIFGALKPTTIIPSKSIWPYTTNFRICTNVFYNGPLVPHDIEWSRVPYGEDFDVTLQLLTRGYKNVVLTDFAVFCSATNAEGGCSTTRTVDNHNASQELLASLWPGLITLKDTIVKTGPWKGQIKKGVRVGWKKAYKQSEFDRISNQLLEF